MNKITPFIWLQSDVASALEFYQNLFGDNAVITKYSEKDGQLFSGTIEIFGQKMVLFNGGDYYKLTPAFSLYIDCENQAEIDYYWDGFINGGAIPSRCGWLSDKYGITWQIIPKMLPLLLHNPETAPETMAAMLKMSKIIIKDIEAAQKP